MILSPALERPLANLISEAPRSSWNLRKGFPLPKKEVPGAKLRIGLRPNRANRLGPLFENVPPRSASPRLDRPLAAAIARLRCLVDQAHNSNSLLREPTAKPPSGVRLIPSDRFYTPTLIRPD